MPPYLLRSLRALGEWITAAGLMWLPPPLPAPPCLAEPPPGHPERLGPPGAPLTALERSLREDLPGWP
ncbi:DUF6059 family protein [Streptomyces sp. ISL-36]|uniref:DUF6059 family protein n=1 Tax=Streptomyces sp. ISL-36 TaxID=2819182 RepID=UPI0025555DB4|nr:DUF6059 family protein [Streptomyces sp. ISL-36]